jgi:hypothetical protein
MAALYLVLADCVLALHLVFILWVVFGVFLTRRRLWLRWLHISCLVWGVLVEITPWPCPLTLFENWLELKAGVCSLSRRIFIALFRQAGLSGPVSHFAYDCGLGGLRREFCRLRARTGRVVLQGVTPSWLDPGWVQGATI